MNIFANWLRWILCYLYIQNCEFFVSPLFCFYFIRQCIYFALSFSYLSLLPVKLINLFFLDDDDYCYGGNWAVYSLILIHILLFGVQKYLSRTVPLRLWIIFLFFIIIKWNLGMKFCVSFSFYLLMCVKIKMTNVEKAYICTLSVAFSCDVFLCEVKGMTLNLLYRKLLKMHLYYVVLVTLRARTCVLCPFFYFITLLLWQLQGFVASLTISGFFYYYYYNLLCFLKEVSAGEWLLYRFTHSQGHTSSNNFFMGST